MAAYRIYHRERLPGLCSVRRCPDAASVFRSISKSSGGVIRALVVRNINQTIFNTMSDNPTGQVIGTVRSQNSSMIRQSVPSMTSLRIG